MRTLVTGFGPFGTVTENPSGLLAEGCGRSHAVLEVAYDFADAFLRALDPADFDVLLMLGVATGRDGMTPELFARNWRGATPDVRGRSQPGPIDPGEPLLVESTLWDAHLLAEIEVGLGLRTSMDAGSYLCNYASYRAIRRFPDKKVGFLHVPPFEKVARERQAEILAKVLADIEDARTRSVVSEAELSRRTVDATKAPPPTPRFASVRPSYFSYEPRRVLSADA